jgi:hypothetical protein
MNNLNITEIKRGRKYWGPKLWYIIHKITYSLSPIITINDQKLLMYYFNLIGSIIPCPYCAAHYNNSISIKLLNRSVSSRQSIIDWFKTQHNDINIMNKGRVYHGYEIDLLYNNTPFNHDLFKELVYYLFERVTKGEIIGKYFVHWILITYKLFPCNICKSLAAQYFLNNDIERPGILLNNSNIQIWLNGLMQNIKHT